MKRSFPTLPRAVRGISLIELMTAVTIGLLILLGLTSVFVNSSTSSRELKNTAEQIENGRYATELLGQDIRHAGFYGELSTLPAVPASATANPCAAPAAGAVSTTIAGELALPVERINPASIPGGCSSLLPAANLQADSDIIVVRRTETTALPVSCTTTGTVIANAVYLQTTPDNAEIQYGVAGTIDSTKNATGAAYSALMARRDQSVAAGATAGTCAAAVTGQFPIVAAKIRKYLTHIYFVAPCSVPADGTSICTGSADDGGRPIPTLKRLELRRDLSTSAPFTIVPVVEGIEAIRFEYGTDTIDSISPASLPGVIQTGLVGDGVTDGYTHTPDVAGMGNTIATRIYVLARNTAPTNGYTDDKTYTLGLSPAYTFTPTGGQTTYKRHVYTAEVRIANQAGRREIPR